MEAAWKEIARIALDRLGYAEERAAAELGELHFRLRVDAICPLPGALESLELLRARGVQLGLITNGGSRGQRAKIERFGLERHFSYIGVEGEVGFGKPDVRAYERALGQLAADPAYTWMVGDNLEWDVAAAQSAGITAIWVDKHGTGLPAGTDVVPDRIVRAVAELVVGFQPGGENLG
jgi:putative hydrolase of the HAD superfamily